MKAEELRIGNLVAHEPTIDDWENIIVKCGTIVKCEISPDSFEPILLTEEWLERFGFEEVIVEGYPIYISRNGFTVEYYSDESIFLILNFEVKVKYVHQLQNLYFALTGEELTIK